MNNVVPFPIPRPSQHRMAQLGASCLAEADRRLIAYTWMWPDGPPGWVGDAWFRHVCLHTEVEMTPAHWPALWELFVAGWLAHQPEWRRAVEISLAELEDAA